MERRDESAHAALSRIHANHQDPDLGISTVSAVELIASVDLRLRPKSLPYLFVYPLTLEIAQLAGRIEGEQAAVGNIIAFEDLIHRRHGSPSRFRGRDAQPASP